MSNFLNNLTRRFYLKLLHFHIKTCVAYLILVFNNSSILICQELSQYSLTESRQGKMRKVLTLNLQHISKRFLLQCVKPLNPKMTYVVFFPLNSVKRLQSCIQPEKNLINWLNILNMKTVKLKKVSLIFIKICLFGERENWDEYTQDNCFYFLLITW